MVTRMVTTDVASHCPHLTELVLYTPMYSTYVNDQEQLPAIRNNYDKNNPLQQKQEAQLPQRQCPMQM